MISKMVCRCVVFGLLGALIACSPKGTRQNSNATSSRSIVVSPLSVQVDDPKLLLSVNSISIEKPAFRGAVHSNTSEDGLLAVVREVAEETLSMKVVGPSKVGAMGQSDSVLRTDIITMDDLKGSSVGGEPARVAFRMGIYSGREQRPVWQANYVYQQEAMAENWLKLGDRLGRDGSGAGWITAQEIFKRGVTQSLEDFNRRRDSQFQGVRPVK